MAGGKRMRPTVSNSWQVRRTALPQLDKRQTIVSKISYLLGVSKSIFEREPEPPDLEIFQALEEQKPARLIRNLSILRTELIRQFKQVNQGSKKILVLSDYVPEDCLQQLAADGINLSLPFRQPTEFIVEANRLIADQISACRDLFPLWIRWEYIERLFIMPEGFSAAGIKAAVGLYCKNRPLYPYQMYVNWTPVNEGNILYSDMKFAVLLYAWNNDKFTDLNKVSGIDQQSKDGVRSFLEGSANAVIVVDCENSDPYKLCAAIRDLNQETLSRISKIVLYDDSHSASAWRILSAYINCPVEHILIDRVKKEKSLVDIRLTAGACKEFYQNAVDSFILVSSDSDYWGLISSLPDARFLVIVERNHVSDSLKATMDTAGISYCYLDDFCSGDCGDIKTDALVREMDSYLKKSIQLNVNAMMEYASRTTRVELSEVERQQFYHQYIKPMHLVIQEDGTVEIHLQDGDL